MRIGYGCAVLLGLTLTGIAVGQEPTLPYTPSLDLASMDKQADPCVNFYEYSCGGWKKNNPIPADQTSWSVYGKLYEDNLLFLRGILEQAAQTSGQRNEVTRQIGDFYAACMDETEVEKQELAPIRDYLDAVGNVHFAVLIVLAAAELLVEQLARDPRRDDLAGFLVLEAHETAEPAPVAQTFPFLYRHLFEALGLPERFLRH